MSHPPQRQDEAGLKETFFVEEACRHRDLGQWKSLAATRTVGCRQGSLMGERGPW